MEINTQKLFRSLAPGLIILVFSVATFKSDDSESWRAIAALDLSALSLGTLGVLLVGWLHHEYLRPKIMNPIWKEIDFKLKRQLIQIVALDDQKANRLLASDRRLTRIFFKVIDSDDSLSKTSDKVRINGFQLTTVIDFQMWSLFFFIINLVASLSQLKLTAFRITFSALLLLILILSERMKNALIKKHEQLGKDQIEELRAHHAKEVEEKLRELLQVVP